MNPKPLLSQLRDEADPYRKSWPNPAQARPSDPEYQIWNRARMKAAIEAGLDGIGTKYPVEYSQTMGAVLIRFPHKDVARFLPFTVSELLASHLESSIRWDGSNESDGEFMSLADFLVADADAALKYCRDGVDWVIWYAAARENWNRFGSKGPPVGSRVVTLVAGYGGGEGIRRVVGSHELEGDYPHMKLFDPPGQGARARGPYLCGLDKWFRDIRVVSVPDAASDAPTQTPTS